MRYFLLFLFFSSTLIACNKEALQHDADIQLIKNYITDNNLAAIEETQANFFYDIYHDGGNSIAVVRDKGLFIDVKFKAYLLDGTVIQDTGNNITRIKLDNAIYGWQLAIPKMRIKDKMLLLLPSRLAYGEDGNSNVSSNSTIPPNSVLVFDIELIDVFPHF